MGNTRTGDEVGPEELNAEDDAEGDLLDNPINTLGTGIALVGWIWAVVALFQNSDSWLWLWGYGWSLAIAAGPIYAVYAAFAWGEWMPIIFLGAGVVTFSIGDRLLGKSPQSFRMLIGILLCLTIYFLPFGIALIRNKKAKLAILALNLFGGWTGILWIVALVWALIPRGD